jgi:protein O-mannosyl-transferase
MTTEAYEPAGNPETTDGLWTTWRWVIGAAGLVMLAFAFWMANSRNQAPATESSPAAAALQRSLQQYQAGQYEEAVASAKEALKENPGSAEAYNNLAVSYLGVRKFDEAIHAVQEAIRLKPDFQLAKNNLAWIQRERTRANGAPGQAPAPSAGNLLNQSMQHAQAGRFKECVDTATQFTKVNPKSAEAFNNIGFCAGKLQQWDVAIQNTQQALRLNPNFQLAKNNLASLQQQKLQSGAAKVP